MVANEKSRSEFRLSPIIGQSTHANSYQTLKVKLFTLTCHGNPSAPARPSPLQAWTSWSTWLSHHSAEKKREKEKKKKQLFELVMLFCKLRLRGPLHSQGPWQCLPLPPIYGALLVCPWSSHSSCLQCGLNAQVNFVFLQSTLAVLTGRMIECRFILTSTLAC